jgi:hypothetical protein
MSEPHGDWPAVEFAMLKQRLRKADSARRPFLVELIILLVLDELDRSGGNSAAVLNEILNESGLYKNGLYRVDRVVRRR